MGTKRAITNILVQTEELYMAIEPDGALTMIEYVSSTSPVRYEDTETIGLSEIAQTYIENPDLRALSGV